LIGDFLLYIYTPHEKTSSITRVVKRNLETTSNLFDILIFVSPIVVIYIFLDYINGSVDMMSEVLEVLAKLSVLVFVISSMFSMGLSLTMTQIIEPLKNTRLVILELVANFILIPAIAYGITRIIPLDESIQTGLILLATAAGAPFLPKLVEIAKGNIAFSVGLMVLLMVVNIIYLPLFLPLLLSGVEVKPWDIAQSLIIMMLIPLAIGLFIKARYGDAAVKIQPTFASASSIAILVLVVLGVVLNFNAMIDLVGSLGILVGIPVSYTHLTLPTTPYV
jgi:BASS family bile acid:Na+ symporter